MHIPRYKAKLVETIIMNLLDPVSLPLQTLAYKIHFKLNFFNKFIYFVSCCFFYHTYFIFFKDFSP